MSRYMRVDELVDGKEMLLDRATHTLIPRIVVTRVCGDADNADGDFPEVEARWAHKPEEFVGRAWEVLEKSRALLKPLYGSIERGLTVGDLSWETAQKTKQKAEWEKRRASMDTRLTVGDLSVATQGREKFEAKHPKEIAVAWDLTVGDLSGSVSESHKIAAEIRKKHQDKVEMRAQVRKIWRQVH